MRERFIERGASPDKIAVVLNSFDEERFDPSRYAAPKHKSDDFLLISHGTIEENYGLDIVVRAVSLLRERIPGLRLEIYGEGTHRPTVEAVVKSLGLEDRVWFSPGFLPLERLRWNAWPQSTQVRVSNTTAPVGVSIAAPLGLRGFG